MYQFPLIETIQEVRQAIETSNKISRDDGQWKLKEKEYSLTFCAYRQSVNTSFPDPETAPTDELCEQYKILREIRGLVFDTVSGKLVSRPLHKFFNVDESEQTKLAHILTQQRGKKFWLLEKMDGQMIVPLIVIDNEKRVLRFATKMGVDSYSAKCVEKYVYGENTVGLDDLDDDVKKNIVRFCEKWIVDGYTLVFEWCSPTAKIVIDYDSDRLILVAIRHNRTGQYVPYPEMKELAEQNGIECVREFETHDTLSEDIIHRIQNESKGVEGVVLRFENDYMYKIKTKYYYEVHKSKQHIQWNALSEGHVWLLVMENKLDDVLPVLDLEETRQALREFSTRLWHAIDEKVKWLQEVVQEQVEAISHDLSKTERKKEFVKYINREKTNRFPNMYDRSMLFLLFDETEKGNSSRDVFEEEVIRVLSIRARNKINDARELLRDPTLKYVPQTIFFGEKE